MFAAERNGVNSVEALNRAKSVVLTKYYERFFNALEKGNDLQLEQTAELLVRLHAKVNGLIESMYRRKTAANKNCLPKSWP